MLNLLGEMKKALDSQSNPTVGGRLEASPHPISSHTIIGIKQHGTDKFRQAEQSRIPGHKPTHIICDKDQNYTWRTR